MDPPNSYEISNLFGDSDSSLSLVRYKIYEAICLVKSQKGEKKIDPSTIGVRFENEETIVLNLDRSSKTHKLLRLPPFNVKKPKFTINFSDNVFLLAKLMLKDINTIENLEILSDEDYTLIEDVPYLNNARASISAEIISDIKEFEISGREFYLEIRDPLAQKKFPARFRAIINKKYRSTFASQPMSLYDYKALSAISVIKEIFHIKKNILKYPEGGKKVFQLLDKVRKLQKEVRTFSGGVSALKVVNWVDDLIILAMAFKS